MSASISIALIIPPTDYSTRLNYRQYENTPLEGITSIGLSLIAKGHHVRVFDCRRRSSTLEWLDSEVPSDTALLGCTTFFDSFQFVCDLANWAKIRRPGATVVAGGPLATGAYCLLLEHSKLDAVVLGEGESEVCAIADHMAKGESSLKGMAGVAVRSPGEIVVTPSPSCEVDLNALPDLDWAFLGIAPGPKAFSFMYSMGRGCTGRCRYCGTWVCS
jgi:hypothetical protein